MINPRNEVQNAKNIMFWALLHKLISDFGHIGPLELAARPPDLTPCDFFVGVSLRVKFTPHGLKILKS